MKRIAKRAKIKRDNSTGVILYRGPSMLGGGGVVCVATWDSDNAKTGDMIQIWILPDNGMTPGDAADAGENSAACGNCPLQRQGCYVNLGHAPYMIHGKLSRGGYPNYDPAIHQRRIEGRKVRFGAYGDPAAIPDDILRHWADVSAGWTGYSHQLFWIDRTRADFLASFLMVSCHTPAQNAEAIRRGWRPFTVIRPEQNPPLNSVECPFYTHGVQCVDCGLCDGLESKARPVYAIAHGPWAGRLANVQAAQGVTL